MTSNVSALCIQDTWYNIDEFIQRHPGGSVIQYYINQDATMVFEEMHRHSKKAWKVLRSLPTVEKPVIRQHDASTQQMLEDFRKWKVSLEERGFFTPSIRHTIYRNLEVIALFAFATYLLSFDSYFAHFLSALTYGLFGGRCGWLQHEAGHHSLSGYPTVDKIMQKISMGCGLMVSDSMWNSMHNKHHATTQKIDHDIDLDTMPLVLFHPKAAPKNGAFSSTWLQYQAYTFIPITSGFLVLFFWMFYLHPRKVIRDKDYLQAFFMLLGHIGRPYLLSKIVGFNHSFFYCYLHMMFSMYITGMYLFGHFSLSHTFMPIVENFENPNWVEYSLAHTVDIDTQSPLISWIMGYLNCQCVHHLFPQMPQFRQPQVSNELVEFAKKWDLPYYHISYSKAWSLMLENLHTVGAGKNI